MIIEEFGDREIYAATEHALERGMSLHEVIAIEMGTLTLPLADAIAWVREHVTVRPGFRAFAEEHDPVILSSGFTELIEPVLEREGISLEVHANRLDTRAGNWRPVWRDDAQCAECGEACKRAGAPRARPSSTSATATRTGAWRSPPTASSHATGSSDYLRVEGRRVRALRGLRSARTRPRPLTAAFVFGQMTKASDLGARQRRSNARSQRPRFVLRLAGGGLDEGHHEEFLYVACLHEGTGMQGRDFLAVVDVNSGRIITLRHAQHRGRAAPLRLAELQLVPPCEHDAAI